MTRTKQTQAPNTGPYRLTRRGVGALPIVNHLIRRLRLVDIVDQYLPARDTRVKIDPAVVVAILVRNLLLDHQPTYGIRAWAATFEPSLLGLTDTQMGLLTDDRVGRVLDQLFDTDRASLLTGIVLQAVAEFNVDTSECHNDSTSITLHGTRPDRGGQTRGGKPVVALKHGHSKDHRPDLPQLVWILTVTADGAVPILHRVTDGNTTDDTTHIDTWNNLTKLTGRTDFLYVADSKLATRPQMDHIHRHHGRFVTVLPRSRTEDKYFRTEWIRHHAPNWTEARRTPGPHLDGPDDVWSTFPHPHPSSEGYRIVWTHSTRHAQRDADDRTRRIHQATTALDNLNERLRNPRCRIKDLLTADNAATTEIDRHHATPWITHYPEHIEEQQYIGERGGRPGPDTRYQRRTRTHWTIRYTTNHDAVTRDATTDGCLPLITNDTTLPDAAILAAYKHQPHLERRHHILKSDQTVTPMHLQRPHRIEALLTCHFIALLIGALLERHLRHRMHDTGQPHLPLYPEHRPCTTPTTQRTLDLFTPITRDHLHDHHGNHIQTFPTELTTLQHQILTLLDLPPTTYQT